MRRLAQKPPLLNDSPRPKNCDDAGMHDQQLFRLAFRAGDKISRLGRQLAIHREIFDVVGIREAWDGVVSDDLVASRVPVYLFA